MIKFNGTELSYLATIKYDGTELTKIIYNGTEVWQKDSTAPSLTISDWSSSSSSPSNVTTSSITVKGTASDSESGLASVTVNGNAVTVSSGSYSTTVSLTGNTTNTITVVAKDNAGNSTTKKAYVYYTSVPTATNLANYYKTDGINAVANCTLLNSNAFSQSGSQLTCKVAGTYQLYYKAYCNTSDTAWQLQLYKNDNKIWNQQVYNGSIEGGLSSSFALAVGDKIYVRGACDYNMSAPYMALDWCYVRKV